MKKMTSPTLRRVGIPLCGILLAACLSCRKQAAAPASSSLDAITDVLNGHRVNGSLTTEEEGTAFLLDYNRGVSYILIDKLDKTHLNLTPSASAQIITSTYGLVIKDLASNRIWLLANNDPESLKRFETVKTLLQGGYTSTLIYGTTVVNIWKA
jgi:hypothetical protein